MSYGYRARFRRSSSSFSRRRLGTGRGITRRPGLYRSRRRGVFKPRFATVGFSRNVEKKYFDKTYISNSLEVATGNSGTGTTVSSNGVMYISDHWGNYSFGTQTNQQAQSNDMLKGLDTGTTARTRIGNKVKCDYVKGAFTFTAALVDLSEMGPQGGEQLGQLLGQARGGYLRTTYRFVIVKDLQVNSTDTEVKWPQVFDTTGEQAGVHSELNVDNMGRFIVLEDKTFTVDADSPQKTCSFMISGSRIGHIRYNGPGRTALTDKGVYVVWAAYVMGITAVTEAISLPSPVGHSRLCFNDD